MGNRLGNEEVFLRIDEKKDYMKTLSEQIPMAGAYN